MGLAVRADAASDLAVVGFAAWTGCAYVTVLTDLPVEAALAAAAVLTLAAAAVGWWRRAGRSPPRNPRPADEAGRRVAPRAGRWITLAAIAAAAVAGGLAGYAPLGWWPLTWAAAAVSVGLAAVRLVRWPAVGPLPAAAAAVRWPAHAAALGAAFVLSALSVLTVRPSADDVYYVNRATAVAELGRIPAKDVILTDRRLPPVAGTGAPVDTFAALQGAIGRLLDLHAASVAYYLTPPIGTALATWALWRLCRQWGHRRLLLVLAVALLYLMFCGQRELSFGNFFLTRMWQGKVLFVAWLVPTLYVALTRWARDRTFAAGAVVLAGGLAGIGLTITATFVVPAVMLVGCVPLVARRAWRALAVPLGALLVPLVVGAVAGAWAPPATPQVTNLHGVELAFHGVFGFSGVAAVGMAALCLAPWLVRDRVGRWVALGVAVVGVVLLAPGVFDLLRDLVGVGGNLRRLGWVVPAPVLVGLLAAAPVPGRRYRRQLTATAVVATVVATGAPIWRFADTRLVARPHWKVTAPVGVGRAVLAHYDGPGPVLAPPGVMQAMALLTAHTKTVNPRSYYTELVPQPRRELHDRLVLTRFARSGTRNVDAAAVTRALDDLHVQLVCLPSGHEDALATLRGVAGFVDSYRAGRLSCLRPP